MKVYSTVIKLYVVRVLSSGTSRSALMVTGYDPIRERSKVWGTEKVRVKTECEAQGGKSIIWIVSWYPQAGSSLKL